MAEPTFEWQLNYGSEGVPTWETVGSDVFRWTGPDGVGDSMPAPVSGANWFDNNTPPDDGELWLDAAIDRFIEVAGRALNQNVLQINETGAEPTADAPEFTAYDDAADAGTRTSPTTWPMIGTSASNNKSCLRAIETTGGVPGAGWGTQTYDADPSVGSCLDGEDSKLVCAGVFAGSDTKKFQLAHNVPNDVAVSGLISFVYSLQYTYT